MREFNKMAGLQKKYIKISNFFIYQPETIRKCNDEMLLFTITIITIKLPRNKPNKKFTRPQ